MKIDHIAMCVAGLEGARKFYMRSGWGTKIIQAVKEDDMIDVFNEWEEYEGMLFMGKDRTIHYYNTNAKGFVAGTVSVDFEFTQKKFTNRLPKNAAVLDFGCGSGRDTKYFISQGYQVDAIDGSIELCRLASEYTGIEVKNIFFNELAQVNRYDGIWACSSILHLPLYNLTDVMHKMVTALKDNGIIYTSFKYGTFAGERNGRYFTDMTEESFADFINRIEDVGIEEQWVSLDVRPNRGEEKWLNLILRKK